jgi:predicted SnoaL-like aldol condensation-catalyzing enzyme
MIGSIDLHDCPRVDSMARTEIAFDFLRMCSRGEVREAYERYVSPDFVHHNAWFPGDRESLLKAMEQNAAAEPNKSFEVKQVVDGGDKVAVLSHLERAGGDLEYAVVHIVRFGDDGRIAELWDLAQEIPKDSPNALGMF